MTAGRSAGEYAAGRRRKADDLRRRAAAIDREADQWERGRQGEIAVANKLEQLRSLGYQVMHDVRWPGRARANIDHVAVGPAGVLVIDAKNWSGRVTVNEGSLRQNGRRRDDELAAVFEAGLAVGALLAMPWNMHVIPVLCLTGSPAPESQRVGSVDIVSLEALVPWVRDLRVQLRDADVHGIAGHLRRVLPSASQPPSFAPTRPGADSASPRRSQPTRRAAPRRRRSQARRPGLQLRDLLLRLGLLGAALLVLPPILTSFASSYAKHVASGVVPPEPSYKTCGELWVRYPSGVALGGVTNVGKPIKKLPTVLSSVYRANRALDTDNDGMACER